MNDRIIQKMQLFNIVSILTLVANFRLDQFKNITSNARQKTQLIDKCKCLRQHELNKLCGKKYTNQQQKDEIDSSVVQRNCVHIQIERVSNAIVRIYLTLIIFFYFFHLLRFFVMWIFSEVRTFLAEQLQPLNIDEQKEWLDNITTHIQSQGLSTPNVEIVHIELAIKVRAWTSWA